MRATKDSGVDWLGEIPADWDVLPARALFRNPSEPSKPDDIHLTPSQKYGVLPQNEYMEISGSRVVLNLSGSEQMRHVEAGDFISHLRSFQGGLEYSPFEGKVSNAYTVLRPRRPLVAGYFKHLFKSTMYVQGLQTTTDQLRDGQSVRFKQLSLLALPEPPLEAQRRIADFLDRETAKIDALIAKQEQLITTLDERRGAVISRAVTRGLVEDRPLHDSGVEWLGRVPADWDVKPIRSLMKFNTEKNAGNKSRNYLSLMANVGVIPYEEKGSVGNKSPEDFEKCKIVRTGDFVLNSMNFGIGSFGVSPYDGICSTVYVVMTPKPGFSSPSFLKHIFSMKAFQKHAQSLGYGILEHRAAIGWHDLKNLGFPVPPLAEQTEIASHLDDETARIDQLRAEAKKMVGLLAERRQALISAAVTGKLEVGV